MCVCVCVCVCVCEYMFECRERKRKRAGFWLTRKQWEYNNLEQFIGSFRFKKRLNRI